MKHVGIIGGGIVGLSAAYFIRKAGFRVTLFDKGNLQDNCSSGNAGMIVPSHFIPLAAPGMIAKGIRWMFNSTSPFYVRPQLSRELFVWGYQFYKHANEKHVTRSMPALSALGLFSKSIFQKWSTTLPFDFGYQERGLLMLYQGAGLEKEEIEIAHRANQLGMEARILSLPEIQKLEPDVKVRAHGGVYYPGDAHVIPHDLVSRLINYLKVEGVVFETNLEVSGFISEGHSIKAIKTSRGEFAVDELIVAAGAWSGAVCRILGFNLPMQAGKGYSFTLQDVKKNTRIPTIFLESRVAVTPMGNALRFGGTMEITGVDHRVNMMRVKGITDSIRNYYPEMSVALPARENVWHGLRPCSPDGMPYIGRSGRFRNMVVATGHAMMGLSLGPGTGKLISEILSGDSPSVDLTLFDPDRYDRVK